ncbi:MAG: RNA methyltransferase [Betaproteobacteria bacterium]|nr:RNA methyltransferase [Betaproteobacteria bacterium]
MKRILSRDNPLFRHLSKLADSPRYRREHGTIVLDGEHLIEAYFTAFGPGGMELIVREGMENRPVTMGWLERGWDEAPVIFSQNLFDALSPVTTPSGLLAFAPIPSIPVTEGSSGFSVLADGLQDPGNLGALIRSAAAAGGHEVVLSSGCADPWSPRSLRGGMGGQFVIRIGEDVDLVQQAREFSGAVVVADADGDTCLFDAELPRHCAFVIGAEGRGVSPALRSCAHVVVRIPMARGIESLNVTAAATMLFYEWRRRTPVGPSK